MLDSLINELETQALNAFHLVTASGDDPYNIGSCGSSTQNLESSLLHDCLVVRDLVLPAILRVDCHQCSKASYTVHDPTYDQLSCIMVEPQLFSILLLSLFLLQKS